MSVDRSRRALEIFEQALELPDDQIPAFLADACIDDEVRAEVQSLLDMSADDGEFLPAVEESATWVGNNTTVLGSQKQRPECPTIEPGSMVMGRYAVGECIGTGGTGMVFRATDARLGRDVAIKVLSGAHVSNQAMRDRFDREMRSVASLAHPNVMGLYDIGDHHGIQIAVMELVEGSCLRDLMGKKLPVREAVDFANGIAAALAAAHQRDLMHRDIKPENIMVSAGGQVKVLDFGLARPKYNAGDTILTGTSVIIGTFPYMSPEQSEGLELEKSTDVFSLGTVLFEMLAGVNPFHGSSIFETMRRLADPTKPRLADFGVRVPALIESLISGTHQHDPTQRPTAQAVIEQLATIQQSTDGAH